MSVKLIITFKIKKEKLASFLNIIKDVKINLPKVDGCQGVIALQSEDDKYTITLLETWENTEKHKAHITHVVDSGAWEKIASHLSEDPVSGYYHQI